MCPSIPVASLTYLLGASGIQKAVSQHEKQHPEIICLEMMSHTHTQPTHPFPGNKTAVPYLALAMQV